MSMHTYDCKMWLNEKEFDCEVQFHFDNEGHIVLEDVSLIKEKSSNGSLWYDYQGRARYTKAFDYLVIPLTWIDENKMISEIKLSIGVN